MTCVQMLLETSFNKKGLKKKHTCCLLFIKLGDTFS